MIDTFWTNQNPGTGLAPIPLTIGDAAATKVLQQVIDMATIYNRGELTGIEVEVLTGVVAPGATKNLTVSYAFGTKANRSPAQMATAAANQVCVLPNAASSIAVYSLPINYQGARYLYVWFDQDATNAGSLVTLSLAVTAKNKN